MDKILISRITTLLGYFGLLVYIPFWHLQIEPKAAEFMSVTLLVQMGPLMFALRGILHGKVYTHAWAMYLALFYFVLGIWYAGDISTRNFGIGFSFLSVLFFLGTMFYTRFQGMAENKATVHDAD
ncbi:MAG TPA: DUF2069 domain-containing protein [Gammaproteobacteria bacterium]|nr:DUF2069 domain-containing protein [Gammaproteobacteria bacterium]